MAAVLSRSARRVWAYLQRGAELRGMGKATDAPGSDKARSIVAGVNLDRDYAVLNPGGEPMS